MKIDQNLVKPNNTRELTQTQKVKPEKPASVQQQTEKLNHTAQAMQSKMLHWFAQAGIKPGSGVSLHQQLDKKLARRRQVSAQRKLHNLESILAKALDFCLDADTVDEIDPDWFFSFIQMAEDVYSPPMQELWGKIFSVEVSRPGSFSLRSLITLKQFTQKDAKIFQSAVSLASRRKNAHGPKLIYGYYQKPSLLNFFSLQKSHQLNLAEFGLSYPNLLALMDMGLIFTSEIESAELDPRQSAHWRCGQHNLYLAAKRPGIALTYYKFTSTGGELARLVQGQPPPLYIDKLRQLLSVGFEVT